MAVVATYLETTGRLKTEKFRETIFCHFLGCFDLKKESNSE